MEFSPNVSLFLYIGVFFLVAFFAYITEKVYKRFGAINAFSFNRGVLKLNPLILMCEIILVLFPIILLTFRYGIGTDYFSYKTAFQNSLNNSIFSFSIDNEFSIVTGNNLLVKVGNFFFHDFHGYLFLTALIIFGFLFYFIKEYTEICRFALMAFICLVIYIGPSMNIVRQTIAVALVVVGFKFIFSRRFVPYLILVLIAMTIHSTAIIMIPVYFLYSPKKEQNAVRLIAVIAFCLLLPIIFVFIFRLLPYIPILSQYTTRYAINSQSSYNIIYIVLKIPIILYILLFYKKLISKDYRNSFYIYLFFIELATSYLGSFSQWAFRIMYYGMISEVVLVPQLLSFVPKRSKIICYIVILGYYIFYFWLLHYLYGHDGIVPYSFSWRG